MVPCKHLGFQKKHNQTLQAIQAKITKYKKVVQNKPLQRNKLHKKRGHVPQAKNINNLNAKKSHVASRIDITLCASRFSLIPPVCNTRNLQNLQGCKIYL